MDFSEKDRDQLKQIARDAIEGVLFGTDKKPSVMPAVLKEKRGAFVTVKKRGELRGCIGYIKGFLPLHETIREMAIQAAFHDPRFNPVSKNEWEDIDIEISVLTPMKKIDDVDEIKVGIHGLYIEKGTYSGLLLPQVAAEYDLDRMAFLEHTCYKAGLPKDAWKSKDTKIFIFSAEVF